MVEVVSDDSVRRDRADKVDEYEQFGVRECWVIDARPGRERADFWILQTDGRYRPGEVAADGCYRSLVLPGFWFHVDWLSAAPLATFAKIAGPDAVTGALK